MTQVTLASPQALDLARPRPVVLRSLPELKQKPVSSAPAAQPPKDTHVAVSSAQGKATTSIALTTTTKPKAPDALSGYNPALGKKVAAAGMRAANSMRSKNWCFRGVKKALTIAYGKPVLSGEFAYEAAAQLARNPRFKEIKVPARDLRKLPAGAIVVWKASRANNAGHISIALGNGKESSDHIGRQMTRNHGAAHQVFVPVK